MITDSDLSTTVTKDLTAAKRLVTCPEDSLVLLQYPWKRKLNIKLDNIQPLKIDIWSNRVRDYHVFTKSKEVTPVISEVKGYGLHVQDQLKLSPQWMNQVKTRLMN